jgi:hypothetical protein
VVFGGAALLVAVASIGLRQIRFDNDVTNLLPRDGRAVPAFRTFLQRFGSLDQLLVVFTAPEGHAISEYADDIDGWVDQLRAAPEIETVDTGRPGPDRDWAWLGDHALLLMRGSALDTALSRLRPDGAAAALAASKQTLAVPSVAIEQLVRRDPLDFFGLLRQQLGGARAGVAIGVTEAGYVTADGRRRLVIAKPRLPPYDTSFSRALKDRLDRIRIDRAAASHGTDASNAASSLDVSFAGGHFIALETEAVVKRESISNSLGSLLLILPLLLIVFRSVWLFACGALPSMASLAVVLGLMGYAHATLSAAATGAAAMLFGLGVDGVVLIYVAYGLATARGLKKSDAIASLGGPSASMFLGMLTTAATFYGLAFVDFPTLQQLGILIGHSMVACGILTLVLIPALLPRAGSRRSKIRPLQWPRLAQWIRRRRVVILAVTVLLTILSGAAATRLRVNATLERLRSTTPAAQAEENVRKMFDLPSDIYVILQQGADLEPLLQANEALVARLRQDAPDLAVEGASALLPSRARQDATSARIRTEAPQVQVVLASVDKAAAALGFRPGAFQPFAERLPQLLAPNQALAFDDFQRHGLGDVLGRFVVRGPDGWILASYAFPSNETQVGVLQRIADEAGVHLTGLALVNRELAARFAPQFARGLVIGSVVVLVMILVSFRDWRLSLLSTLPTIVGLIWTAGLLAAARISLDLFAVFAVVTFVGIGIDYGIHLVHRYQHERDATTAVAQLAPVIVVAGVITLLGYGTLITSSYPPLQSMGIVSVVSVFSLVAASVLMLPALLELLAPAAAHSETLPR